MPKAIVCVSPREKEPRRTYGLLTGIWIIIKVLSYQADGWGMDGRMPQAVSVL